MSHNEKHEDTFETESYLAESEFFLKEARRTQKQDDWEEWELNDWGIWYDKMMNYPERSFEESFLRSLRCEYVPDNIGPCPHCENAVKRLKREKLYSARMSKISGMKGYHPDRIDLSLVLMNGAFLIFAYIRLF